MARVQGDLSVMSAADVLIWLGNRQRTGELTLERGVETKKIAIEAGAAVRASSSDPREYFGQFLVNFGLVTEDQLTRAFQTQQDTRVMLGRILIMIGICSEEQVRKTLEFQLRETILNAVGWSDGRFIFDALPTIERPEGDLGVAIPLLEVHHEGAQRAQHWEAIRAVFPSEHMSMNVHESRVPSGLRPSTFEGRILALARAGLTVEATKLDLHSTDFHFYARLYELYRQGVVEPRETGPIQPFLEYSPLPHGPHDQLAEQAFEQADYLGAMRHAAAGMEVSPSDARLAELSREAEKKHVEAKKRELPSQDAVPRLLQPIEEILQRRISAKERYILTRIDGSKSVHAIMQLSPMREVEAAEIFSKLQAEGLIEF